MMVVSPSGLTSRSDLVVAWHEAPWHARSPLNLCADLDPSAVVTHVEEYFFILEPHGGFLEPPAGSRRQHGNDRILSSQALGRLGWRSPWPLAPSVALGA